MCVVLLNSEGRTINRIEVLRILRFSQLCGPGLTKSWTTQRLRYAAVSLDNLFPFFRVTSRPLELEGSIYLQTQPLTEISTRNISRVEVGGGKGGRCVKLTTSPLHIPIVWKSGSLKLLEP